MPAYTGALNATLTPVGGLSATLGGRGGLTAFLNLSSTRRYEEYNGQYEVTSFVAEPLLTTSLILPTNDKHMHDDVTVYSVPTREEYNEAGGVTFTIGTDGTLPIVGTAKVGYAEVE